MTTVLKRDPSPMCGTTWSDRHRLGQPVLAKTEPPGVRTIRCAFHVLLMICKVPGAPWDSGLTLTFSAIACAVGGSM